MQFCFRSVPFCSFCLSYALMLQAEAVENGWVPPNFRQLVEAVWSWPQSQPQRWTTLTRKRAMRCMQWRLLLPWSDSICRSRPVQLHFPNVWSIHQSLFCHIAIYSSSLRSSPARVCDEFAWKEAATSSKPFLPLFKCMHSHLAFCNRNVICSDCTKIDFVCWLQYLYNLHEVAEKHDDGQMADFVEVMLEEQVFTSLKIMMKQRTCGPPWYFLTLEHWFKLYGLQVFMLGLPMYQNHVCKYIPEHNFWLLSESFIVCRSMEWRRQQTMLPSFAGLARVWESTSLTLWVLKISFYHAAILLRFAECIARSIKVAVEALPLPKVLFVLKAFGVQELGARVGSADAAPESGAQAA